MAGPGLEQRAELVLDLFPGDGRRSSERRSPSPGGACRSSLPSAPWGAPRSRTAASTSTTPGIPWREVQRHPHGGPARRLHRAGPGGGDPVVQCRHPRAGGPSRPGGAVRRAAPASARCLSPREAFPGEDVELVLSVTNEDDRTVEALTVDWPAGLTAAEADPGPPVGAGETSEHRWQVHLEPGADGALPLVIRAEGGGLRASPVAVAPLGVRPVPDFAARVAEGEAVRGEPLRLRLVWSNPGPTAIPYEELAARASAGFEALEGAPGVSGVQVDIEERAVEVRVPGPGELGAGEDRSVELDLRPTGTGPFAWTGGFRPPAREGAVDLGLSVVRVAAPEGPRGGLLAEVTDLELVDQGLAAELESVLDDIPLPRGSTVSLVQRRGGRCRLGGGRPADTGPAESRGARADRRRRPRAALPRRRRPRRLQLGGIVLRTLRRRPGSRGPRRRLPAPRGRRRAGAVGPSAGGPYQGPGRLPAGRLAELRRRIPPVTGRGGPPLPGARPVRGDRGGLLFIFFAP